MIVNGAAGLSLQSGCSLVQASCDIISLIFCACWRVGQLALSTLLNTYQHDNMIIVIRCPVGSP